MDSLGIIIKRNFNKVNGFFRNNNKKELLVSKDNKDSLGIIIIKGNLLKIIRIL